MNENEMRDNAMREVREIDGASQDKLRWEVRKLRLDVVLASVAVALVLMSSVGALLLYSYFLRYGFNAGGIAAADTLSLLLLVFGFALTTFVVLAYVTTAAYPVTRAGHWLAGAVTEQRNVWRLRRRGATPEGEVILLIGNPIRQVWWDGMSTYLWFGGALLALFLLAIYYANANLRFFMGAMLLVGVWLSHFVFGGQESRYSNWPKFKRARHPFDAWMDGKRPAIKRTLIALTVTVSAVLTQLSWIQDASMQVIGYRKLNVSVRMSRDDFNTVVDRATRAGYALNACAPLDPNAPVIDHMDVLSHALGTTALIRYPALPFGAPETAEAATVRFEPLNASLMVMSGVGERAPCREFLTYTIFKPGQAVFSMQGESMLEAQLAWLEGDKPSWKVSIAVLEPGELGAGSLAQAAALKAYLLRRYRLSPSSVSIDAKGAELKRDCAGVRNAGLCNQANQRIEIRAEPSLSYSTTRHGVV